MKHRALDDTGDWKFGKGVSDITVDQNAIALNVRTRVLSWAGDCFFALTDGVDWRSRLDAGQQAALTEELKAVILQSYGVVGINSITPVFKSGTRSLTVTFDIQTIFSTSFQQTIKQIAGE